ncbi:MAG TPA: hypothetical protein VKU82_04160 [Planctomycetaceae bacterium]|nr:hypothetical protein [Planctomycetaceae bacterium]
MRRILAFSIVAAAVAVSLAAWASSAQANTDDEWWGGYWRSYPYYDRPHPLRYAPYNPTIYYGHAPAGTSRLPEEAVGKSGASYDRFGNPYTAGPHIGSYHPIYGPGRYFGPSIAPFYAPGRDRYGTMKYGWW